MSTAEEVFHILPLDELRTVPHTHAEALGALCLDVVGCC